MEKNKTGKYLKYALGEIILVVIGILIALSINNWNEKRLNKNLSIEFHERYIDELNALSERLVSDEERADQLVEYLNKSVVILKKGILTETASDTLNFAFKNFFQFTTIDEELKTFQEMESTGQLGLIYNRELKNHLLEYLAMLESISKIFDQMTSKVNNTDLVDKYVTVFKDAGTFNTKLEYDFNEIVKDRYLINKLARFGYMWQTKQFFSKVLSKDTSELKNAFLEEIEQLQ